MHVSSRRVAIARRMSHALSHSFVVTDCERAAPAIRPPSRSRTYDMEIFSQYTGNAGRATAARNSRRLARNLGARARAGGPASRGCPGRAAGRDAPARPVARWPLVLRVSVPDGECIVVVGIVWSACAALRDSLLATHGTAWKQTCRRAGSTPARLLACRLRARARAKREQRAVAIGMACRGAAVARRRQRRAPAAPVR